MDAPAPPRVVASDLDGTLLRSDGTVSARTVAALLAATERGAEVFLVTGRPPRWVDDVGAAVGCAALAVCSNGALVYDLAARRVVLERAISAADAAETARLLRLDLPEITFAMEGLDGFAREPGYATHFDAHQELRIAPAPALFDRPVAKLLVRHPRLSSDELLARAAELVGHLVLPTHSAPGGVGGLVEISALGVSKATTLALLCAERGLGAADVIAFGDMPNDLPLLAWAGRPVAVATAHPEVLAAVGRHEAGVVTASNDDDGVAAVLELAFGPTRS